jgi:hypothetical protein
MLLLFIPATTSFQVTKLRENPQVLPLISRMVPRVNPRIFRAQGYDQQQGSKPLQQYTCYELNMSLAGIEPGWGG